MGSGREVWAGEASQSIMCVIGPHLINDFAWTGESRGCLNRVRAHMSRSTSIIYVRMFCYVWDVWEGVGVCVGQLEENMECYIMRAA